MVKESKKGMLVSDHSRLEVFLGSLLKSMQGTGSV